MKTRNCILLVFSGFRRGKRKYFNHCLMRCKSVCVCFLPIYSGHQPLDVPAGVTQEEGHTGFLFRLPAAVRALIFLARRIHLFLSLVDREVEFCVLTILHLLGNFLFIYVLVRKNPMTVATSQWVCVCVCVFFPFILRLDIKFVGRTGRGHTGGRSHRISHPPSFCGACLNFSREKDSAILFPRRP